MACGAARRPRAWSLRPARARTRGAGVAHQRVPHAHRGRVVAVQRVHEAEHVPQRVRLQEAPPRRRRHSHRHHTSVGTAAPPSPSRRPGATRAPRARAPAGRAPSLLAGGGARLASARRALLRRRRCRRRRAASAPATAEGAPCASRSGRAPFPAAASRRRWRGGVAGVLEEVHQVAPVAPSTIRLGAVLAPAAPRRRRFAERGGERAPARRRRPPSTRTDHPRTLNVGRDVAQKACASAVVRVQVHEQKLELALRLASASRCGGEELGARSAASESRSSPPPTAAAGRDGTRRRDDGVIRGTPRARPRERDAPREPEGEHGVQDAADDVQRGPTRRRRCPRRCARKAEQGEGGSVDDSRPGSRRVRAVSRAVRCCGLVATRVGRHAIATFTAVSRLLSCASRSCRQ